MDGHVNRPAPTCRLPALPPHKQARRIPNIPTNNCNFECTWCVNNMTIRGNPTCSANNNNKGVRVCIMHANKLLSKGIVYCNLLFVFVLYSIYALHTLLHIICMHHNILNCCYMWWCEHIMNNVLTQLCSFYLGIVCSWQTFSCVLCAPNKLPDWPHLIRRHLKSRPPGTTIPKHMSPRGRGGGHGEGPRLD